MSLSLIVSTYHQPCLECHDDDLGVEPGSFSLLHLVLNAHLFTIAVFEGIMPVTGLRSLVQFWIRGASMMVKCGHFGSHHPIGGARMRAGQWWETLHGQVITVHSNIHHISQRQPFHPHEQHQDKTKGLGSTGVANNEDVR